MEDRIIALTPWVVALMFELLGICALVLGIIHFTWQEARSIALILMALARTLPPVLRRLHAAWQAPSLAAG
jgi:hypothetical protein